MMSEMQLKKSMYFVVLLVLTTSSILNLLFVCNWYYVSINGGGNWELSWTKKAAKEAEAVAAISCSGHGRVYLDGLILDGNQNPVCECNSCYRGPDCSEFDTSCSANADGGDPLFLEPFWMQNAASSALVVAGWHRMAYHFHDHSFISQDLEIQIRKLHAVVGNAITQGRYIIFGAGSTQLFNAAVHALSPHNSSSPASVVASIPFYPIYKLQTDLFQSVDFRFQGDTSLWTNNSDTSTELIEFVTSPNNPDGYLNREILQGYNVKTIYDHVYYWPHFTAIASPADEDIMLFSLSKLTGHAGSRFGWAIIKDVAIYQRMTYYLHYNTFGVSRDAQLRALKLLKVVLKEGGKPIFEFGHNIMRERWERLSKTVSMSERFSLQNISSQYCNFFQKVREASPAYGWLKCEREDQDKDCYDVLQRGNITGRPGSLYYAGDKHVRLSIIRRQDDFDLLIDKLSQLVFDEDKRKEI